MPNLCCGIKYSKNDINTYWCIETDVVKPIQKKYVGGKKIDKEIVESYTCKKCGSFIVKALRFSQNKIVEVEKLSGAKAIEFLDKTKNIRHRKPQIPPIKKEKTCKTIPFVYGKFINEETQRARYINELDWADKEIIKTKIVHLTKP